MLFMLRPAGGDQLAGGTWVQSDGSFTEVAEDATTVTSQREWTNPESGCTYPLGWTLEVDGETFQVEPVMDAQEMSNPMIPYWEGAATVSGDATGRAYVELTGYCQ